MRPFTLWILIPSTIVLIAVAMRDYGRGNRLLFRAVLMIGAIGRSLALPHSQQVHVDPKSKNVRPICAIPGRTTPTKTLPFLGM